MTTAATFSPLRECALVLVTLSSRSATTSHATLTFPPPRSSLSPLTRRVTAWPGLQPQRRRFSGHRALLQRWWGLQSL